MMRFSENSGFDHLLSAGLEHNSAGGRSRTIFRMGQSNQERRARLSRDYGHARQIDSPHDLLDGAACVAVFPSFFNPGVFDERGGAHLLQ
jgi:hypothetical protein